MKEINVISEIVSNFLKFVEVIWVRQHFVEIDQEIFSTVIHYLPLIHRGASNEYPQHMFLWRNKKKIFT